MLAVPAQAQTTAAFQATLESNQVFRGETISQDRPGLTLAVSIDDRSGLFAGADVSFASGPDQPRFTASSQYAGYAVRVGRVSLEGGIVHRNYPRVYDEAYRPDYVEGFVGITTSKARARFYVSPNYLQDGRNTYYGEVDAKLASLGKWHLSGHFGVSLIPHDKSSPLTSLISYEDWGLNASRKLGPFDFNLGAVATNYPVFGPSGKIRVRASVGLAF